MLSLRAVGGIDDGKLTEAQVREVKKLLSNLLTIELKDLINIKVFSGMPVHWQQQLIHLLPKLDQQIASAKTAELSFSALNNEFFSHAMFQWQERFFEDSDLRLRFLEKLKNTTDVAEMTKRTFSATSTKGKCAAHVSEQLGSNYAKNLPPIPAEQMVPGGLYKQMFFQHGHKSKSGSQIPSEKMQTLAADKTANMIMDDFGVEVLNNLGYKSGISGSDLKMYKFPFNVPNEVVSCSANSEKALAPCESVASTQRHSGGEAQNEVIRFGDCSEPCEATDATSVLDPLWKALMMPVEVKLTPLNLETSMRTSASNGSDGKANCQIGASSDKSVERKQRSWCNGSIFPARGHLAYDQNCTPKGYRSSTGRLK
uniref:ASX DEUBAD domain-containing protein n=1 Tax=Eptatretus burgeri TaxID=7764 RepID=A0A8C4QR44_EPTBU